MGDHIWYFKLPDDSEHKFFYGPESTNPFESVSGFKQGPHYLVQAASLSGASGLNPYALPLASGTLPEWCPSDQPDCYFVKQTDVVAVSGFRCIP